MARGRKNSNDPLTLLITAFLMIPFAIVGIFRLLFRGISCLAYFIGRYIEKRQNNQQAYRANYTNTAYRSKTTHNTNSNIACQNTKERHSTSDYHSNTTSASLYELLRIPDDPDPDFTISAAPDECFDDLDDDYEKYDDKEIESGYVDEDEYLEELGDIEVSDSDVTIMGLALYDALMKDDD